MNYLKFLLLGVGFGIMMAKAEIISWFRIYEMFRFESFHMYGTIGSAVTLGVLFIFLIKKFQITTQEGEPMSIAPKKMSITRYLLGGILFGLGWALAGACPGPMFVLVGYGYLSLLIVISGAVMGTFIYGIFRKRLPH